jgi:serine acetyltransferase
MKIVRIPARIFFALITFCGLAVAAVVTRHTAHLLCFEVGFELRTVVLFFFYFWTYLFTVHRLWLWRFPLKSGEVVPESSQETVTDVYMLLHIFFFNLITRSGLLPAPFFALYYRALGAHIGKMTVGTGIIYDASLVTIGERCILGEGSLLVPHMINGMRTTFFPIEIGDRVTVGFKSSIMGGARIEDDAIIAGHSLVLKNAHVKKGEIWAGVPAKKIGDVVKSSAS